MTAPDANGWLPIDDDTPRDGRQILTVGPADTGEAYVVHARDIGATHWFQTTWWAEMHKAWVGWPLEGKRQPTHWQPLPDPPA